MTAAPTTPRAGSRALEHISVEEAMHHGVLGCPFETPLTDVARMMAANRVHAIVGLSDFAEDDTRVWGVVSDRDLVAMAAAGGDATVQTAGGSAATEVVTIGRRDTVRRAAQVMDEHGLSHLLVVEPGSDRPLGVLSSLDVAAALAGFEPERRRESGSRVTDLMTTRVVFVPPELSLKDAATVLVENGISGVPVVSGGAVVGVLSEADIVEEEQGAPAGRKRWLGWVVGNERDTFDARLAALTAGDAMSAPAITIEPWRPASTAATLMTRGRIKRLPVVQNGKLVGIVTRSDLVRAFARGDEEIEQEIRDRVVVHEFWQLPEDVSVMVNGGRVTLSGLVDGEITRKALPEAVQRVPGVVAVSSTLKARGSGAGPRWRRRNA